MKIPELADIIYREAQQKDPVSILVLGPPGVGKTRTMTDVAKRIAVALGLEYKEYDDETDFDGSRHYVYIPLPLLEMEAPDLTGQLRESADGTTVYKPPRWVKVASLCRSFIFIDDLTNARRDDVLSSAFKILNEKMAGFYHFRRDTIIVSAGNRTEDNSIARPLPKPIMAGKVWTLDLGIPAVKDWANFTDAETIDKTPVPWDRRCLGYLMCFESDIVSPPEDDSEMLHACASPRSWTKLAQRLSSTLVGQPQEVIREGAVGFLGPTIGEKFAAFIKNEIPNPKQLLERPEKFEALSHDAKFLAIASVAQHVSTNVPNPKKAAELLSGLADNIVKESADFIVLLVMSLPKSLPSRDAYREQIAVELTGLSIDVASALEGIMRAMPR